MARTSGTSPEDAIQGNLGQWCYEVGSDYEEFSRKSAEKFIGYIGKKPVVDLGAGDGAATNVFVANGNPTTAVDINREKLDRIHDALTLEKDIVGFLEHYEVGNIFMHHVLEHIPNYQEVLDLIGKYLKKGRYVFISVPKGDKPHSVHYVAFDSVTEIMPPGLEVVESWDSNDPGWPEFGIIARK